MGERDAAVGEEVTAPRSMWDEAWGIQGDMTTASPATPPCVVVPRLSLATRLFFFPALQHFLTKVSTVSGAALCFLRAFLIPKPHGCC